MARAQRLGCLEALVLEAALPTEAASTGSEVAALLALRLRRARRRLASRGVSQAPACFCRGEKLRKPVFQHHVPLKGHSRSEAATCKTTENDFSAQTLQHDASQRCQGLRRKGHWRCIVAMSMWTPTGPFAKCGKQLPLLYSQQVKPWLLELRLVRRIGHVLAWTLRGRPDVAIGQLVWRQHGK